jgi:hypothetical protein
MDSCLLAHTPVTEFCSSTEGHNTSMTSQPVHTLLPGSLWEVGSCAVWMLTQPVVEKEVPTKAMWGDSGQLH